MQYEPKSLDAMTVVERTNLIATVVNSLEDFARIARNSGDVQFETNSRFVAGALKGFDSRNETDLRAAELLLEQGITLIQSYAERKPTGLSS